MFYKYMFIKCIFIYTLFISQQIIRPIKRAVGIVARMCLLVGLMVFYAPAVAEETVIKETNDNNNDNNVVNVSNKKAIIIGGVMDLEGRSKGLGLGMKAGIEAALANQTINNRRIQFMVINDSYTPEKTIKATNVLVEKDVLLFVGNVGTPTAKVALPILAKNNIPAFGFFTGAGLLRSTKGEGDIINYRASYVQETKAVIEAALKKGLGVENICAYVQNDAYGMAGVKGIRKALEAKKGAEVVLNALDKVLNTTAEQGKLPQRNGIGPVGVYTRNTFIARDGYDSLKAWEKKQNSVCRLIVTVGSYASIARFIAYANDKQSQQQQPSWFYSAVSFTGADNFATDLNRFTVRDRVIMTQVVPLENSTLAIVKDAKKALGKAYGYVSQEGYIVGKLLLYGLKQLEKNDQTINRQNLLAVYNDAQFDLDGLAMDFRQDNQGSDWVVMTALSGSQWLPVTSAMWSQWLKIE